MIRVLAVFEFFDTAIQADHFVHQPSQAEDTDLSVRRTQRALPRGTFNRVETNLMRHMGIIWPVHEADVAQ